MSLLNSQVGGRVYGLGGRQRSLAQSLHLDIPLLVCLLALAGTSLFVLYSASGQNMDIIERQAVRLLIGFIIMLALAQINAATLIRWTPVIFTIGVLLFNCSVSVW